MDPRVPTDELRQALLRSIKRGAPHDVAAAVAGVSVRTWHRWRQKAEAGEEPYAALMAEVERAEADQELCYVTRIRKAGRTDWKADAWLLERSKPQRWGSNGAPREQEPRRPVPATTGDPWLEGEGDSE